MTSFGFAEQPVSLTGGETRSYNIFGSFLRVMHATRPFKLRFSGGQTITAGLGFYVEAGEGQVFQDVEVLAPDDAPVELLLTYGVGKIGNDAVQLAGFIETTRRQVQDIQTGKVTNTTAGPTEIVGVNPNRRAVFVRNVGEARAELLPSVTGQPVGGGILVPGRPGGKPPPGGTSDPVPPSYIPSDAVGLRLEPGEGVKLEVQAALYLPERPTDSKGVATPGSEVVVTYWEEVFSA